MQAFFYLSENSHSPGSRNFFCNAILTAQILGAAKMQQLQKNGEPT